MLLCLNSHFEKMAAHISAATAVLIEASTAASEIDRVLAAMIKYNQPVYIGVPVDIAYADTRRESVGPLLDTSLPPNDPQRERGR